jgi:hypothetical protein
LLKQSLDVCVMKQSLDVCVETIKPSFYDAPLEFESSCNLIES